MKKLFTAVILFTLMFAMSFSANAQKQKLSSVSVGSSDSDNEIFDDGQCEKFLQMMKENAKAKGAAMSNRFHASYNAFYAGNCPETLNLSNKDIKRIVRGDLEYKSSDKE